MDQPGDTLKCPHYIKLKACYSRLFCRTEDLSSTSPESDILLTVRPGLQHHVDSLLQSATNTGESQSNSRETLRCEQSEVCMLLLLTFIQKLMVSKKNEYEEFFQDRSLYTFLTQVLEKVDLLSTVGVVFQKCLVSWLYVTSEDYRHHILQCLVQPEAMKSEGVERLQLLQSILSFKLLVSNKGHTQTVKKACVASLRDHWELIVAMATEKNTSDMTTFTCLKIWKKILKLSKVEEQREMQTYFTEETGNIINKWTELETKPLSQKAFLDLFTFILTSKNLEAHPLKDDPVCCSLCLSLGEMLQQNFEAGRLDTAEAAAAVSAFCDEDEEQLISKKMLLLLLLVTAALADSGDENWYNLLKGLNSMEPVYRRVLDLFSDQDDQMVTAMSCLLSLYLRYRSSEPTPHTVMDQEDVCAHRTFLHFSDLVCYDRDVLLDLLSSPETCFLKFLLRYLKLLLMEWEMFVQVCEKVDEAGVNEGDAEGLEDVLPEALSIKSKEESEQKMNTENGNIENRILNKQFEKNSEHKEQENAYHYNTDIYSCGDFLTNAQVKDNTPQFLENEKSSKCKSHGEKVSNDKTEKSKSSSVNIGSLVDYGSSSDSEKEDSESNTNRNGSQVKSQTKESVHCENGTGIQGNGLKMDETLNGKETDSGGLNAEIKGLDECTIQSDDASDERRLPVLSQTQVALLASAYSSDEDLTSDASVSNQVNDSFECESNGGFDERTLDKVMTMLIRLQLAVERLDGAGLFAYRAEPLLKLMERCIDLYEFKS